MPELPEVETIINGLRTKVRNRTFVDIWTDWPKIVKKPGSFGVFKKDIIGRKIQRIWRRGKNILFDLSGGRILLVHQKMTGHLLLGEWKMIKNGWKSEIQGPLSDDPRNGFLHVIFFLNDGVQLALSDMRKFAKIELWRKKELEKSDGLNSLGPEPLDKSFTSEKFKKVLPQKGKIKQVLMNQNIIAGIGNIYSDEILWEARIHPLRNVADLSGKDLKEIYVAIKKILEKAIRLKGDSMSDFRLVNGEKGGYQEIQNVYRREGMPCFRKDGGIIKRIKIGGRSAHFCPICQK
ncbi:MAG: DNA-formamidopyrimidine glycosylase [Patescibacteria group bacterium]